jgi:hypothetical protein
MQPFPVVNKQTASLFPTVIDTMVWDASDTFNQAVSKEIDIQVDQFFSVKPDLFKTFNFFKTAPKELSEPLKKMFIYGLEQYIKNHMPKDTFEKCDLHIRSWPRIYKKTQLRSMMPHVHTNVNFVATYYASVPNPTKSAEFGFAPGATVILDTRGLINMGFEQTQQTCAAIDPVPGLMIIMPAHAMHYVEPISDDQSGRSVVVCNAVLLPKELKYEKV